MRSSVGYRRQKEPTFWLVINRILLILVSLGLIAIVALWFYPELERRNEMAANLEKQEQELAKEQLLRKQREREIYLLQNDKAYIETIARDKLDLMKEGETIFRLDPSKKPAGNLPPAN